MGFAPCLKGENDLAECVALCRQAVFNPGRNFGIDFAMHQSVCLKLTQLTGEHPLGDTRHHAVQFVKAFGAIKQMVHHNAFPLAANDIKCAFHRAAGAAIGCATVHI